MAVILFNKAAFLHLLPAYKQSAAPLSVKKIALTLIYLSSAPVLLADCQIVHFVLCCDAFVDGSIDGHSVRPISEGYEAVCSSLWSVRSQEELQAH